MNKKIKKRLDESQDEQNKYPGNNKASPQIENGYTRIANELLEAMARINLTPTEWKILMVIIRNTYGYHKKEERIKLAKGISLMNKEIEELKKELKKWKYKMGINPPTP